MRVLILYNEPVLPPDHPESESEHEILSTVDSVAEHLTKARITVARLGLQRDPTALVEGVRRDHPDVIFNLFEGLADDGDTEAHVAGLLEWLGVPFTGCPARALVLARDKHRTKLLLKGAGLPTPDFFLAEHFPVRTCPLKWPVIVKPTDQDASVGLDQGSVVTDLEHLNQRIAHLSTRYGAPVLVEQYIAGREFNVGLIEVPDLRVLPLAEIRFDKRDPEFWPIVTYDAKWKPSSRDYVATPPSYPTDVSPRLADRLRDVATSAFRLLDCRDYARVDFRVSPADEPYVLEVNPNPDLNPTAGLAGGLAAAGLTHAQFVLDLVRTAKARGDRTPTVSPPICQMQSVESVLNAED